MVRRGRAVVRRLRAGRQVLSAVAVLLLTAALSPLIVVAGEPLRRSVLASHGRPGRSRARRPSRTGAPVAAYSYGPAGTAWASWSRRSFWMVLVSNPLWIVLTAPARWLADRASGYRHRGRPGPPAAGVREPRRPRPDRPAGAIALAEPRTAPVIVRLLGTVRLRRAHRDD